MTKTKASRPQISMIHTLKSKIGLSDDDYRAMLEGFGVESSKDLTSLEAKEFIEALIKLAGQKGVVLTFPAIRCSRGFTKSANGKSASSNGIASYAQQAKIKHLWSAVSRAPEPDQPRALNSFLEKRFQISRLEWLPRERVGKVIRTLETMIKQPKVSKSEEVMNAC
ncbi:MAG: regulatory protein GemA [Chitinispirillia bacterium]|nr:regulatory protein GemA [Chitinispirillia bacterium]